MKTIFRVPSSVSRWSSSRRYRNNEISTEYSDYYPRDGAHFRHKVPLTITNKKVVGEESLQKREWKLARRKKRRTWHTGRRWKTFAKLRSNRDYRRYAKAALDTGQYHKLTKTLPKNFCDPWDWS